MRILLYSLNFEPELTGTGKYAGEMAARLAESGHSVRVITAPPYYPDWQVASGYKAWRYRLEEISGNEVIRCPLWVPRRPRGFSRLLHLLSFAVSSAPRALESFRWKPDIVFLIAPTLMCAPAALVLARLTGAPAWLHIQDFELDVALGLGMIKGPSASVMSRIEAALLRKFDVVSTISPKMIERLHEKGISQHRTRLFPNWVDTTTIYPLDRQSILRQELGLGRDTIVALYAGNMGEKQGLDMLIKAASHLENEANLKFVLAGSGAARSRLQKASQNMKNVLWLPLQPLTRLNELLNLADIHVLPQQSSAADLVLPSKLTGMLASGRPIVATATEGTQIANIVTTCGQVVPPNDVPALINAVKAFAANNELRKSFGLHAREYANQHLSRDGILTAHEKSLLELIGHTRASGSESVLSNRRQNPPLSKTAEYHKRP